MALEPGCGWRLEGNYDEYDRKCLNSLKQIIGRCLASIIKDSVKASLWWRGGACYWKLEEDGSLLFSQRKHSNIVSYRYMESRTCKWWICSYSWFPSQVVKVLSDCGKMWEERGKLKEELLKKRWTLRDLLLGKLVLEKKSRIWFYNFSVKPQKMKRLRYSVTKKGPFKRVTIGLTDPPNQTIKILLRVASFSHFSRTSR